MCTSHAYARDIGYFFPNSKTSFTRLIPKNLQNPHEWTRRGWEANKKSVKTQDIRNTAYPIIQGNTQFVLTFRGFQAWVKCKSWENLAKLHCCPITASPVHFSQQCFSSHTVSHASLQKHNISSSGTTESASDSNPMLLPPAMPWTIFSSSHELRYIIKTRNSLLQRTNMFSALLSFKKMKLQLHLCRHPWGPNLISFLLVITSIFNLWCPSYPIMILMTSLADRVKWSFLESQLLNP